MKRSDSPGGRISKVEHKKATTLNLELNIMLCSLILDSGSHLLFRYGVQNPAAEKSLVSTTSLAVGNIPKLQEGRVSLTSAFKSPVGVAN